MLTLPAGTYIGQLLVLAKAELFVSNVGGFVALTVILVRLEQFAKERKPRLVTLSGISMLVSPLQFSKVYLPILVTLEGIVIIARLVQFVKVLPFIVVTPLPIVQLVRLVQPWKAL